MNNIICVCGASVQNNIQFCKVCGLGLPELVIELKEPRANIMILDDWQKEWISEIKEEHEAFIKLSELF
ncbi:MAG: hypothetical protein KBE38_15215 [Ignavibacterium sp.]|nr:hypothetical protein [Ignavibacterium sp.]